ncbi:hypothetical protein O6H91_23G061000 [Diphasiastrum complanatum]|uniref:Uncharacterized protein n=1 Tax=Diphasiastrum complanatum TaxID=34168 RepID=A0ACC2ABB3_DIPCM|nr:hypothetical protein O6H91_23G061000 [Diphasiastrum complanatum]
MEAPEDTVFYQIFSDSLLSGESSLPQALQHLDQLRIAALDIVEPITRSYIWQHEPFNLNVASQTPPLLRHALDREEELVGRSLGIASSPSSSSDHSIPHLFGKIKYGDNVEDEWFVVYLLFELSRQFSAVSVRVWDSDGEFLLIEAAYEIPRWLKPENSTNRIFIRYGSLHILPVPSSPADIYRLPVKPSLKTALQLLKEGVIETRAGQKVQGALQKRLTGYPERARKNMHKARCRVPLPVAQILKMEPQLISLAVEAFYNRDLDSMKAVARMDKFLPKGSDGQPEMVNVIVSMSRAMYGQLVQQVFQAPRCYPMPPFSPRYKEAELGMKLTCGFEMMYRERSKYQPSQAEDGQNSSTDFAVGNAGDAEDCSLRTEKGEGEADQRIVVPTDNTYTSLQNDVGWQAFRKSLESRGYFRGLLEGSREHRILMHSAIARYKQTNLFSRVSAAMRAPITRINEILSLPPSALDFSDAECQETDDDSWLYTGEEDLANAMHERQKETDAYEAERVKHRQVKKTSKVDSSTSNVRDINKESYDPQELASSMQAFVESISSFEGAEIPGIDKKRPIDDPVSPRKLMKELTAALGLQGNDVDFEEADSAYSSMESDYDDSSESDVEGQSSDPLYAQNDQVNKIGRARPKAHLEEGFERPPGGQIDDVFMQEYSEILQQELKETSLAKTFARVEDMPSTSSQCRDIEEADGDTENLGPVDVNFNLVKNMLESYASQHGMPGPASNLLGAMGLQLPDDLREHDDKKQG